MRQVITSLLIVICLALVAVATRAVRRGHLTPRATRCGAALCGVAIVAMVLSDYPYQGNKFWADHSVLAAIVSSLLMVGVVFLAYEAQERTEQEQLAVSLSGAGLGGLVDHVVDVEVALALATSPKPPDAEQPQFWSGWDQPEKPLRWLRDGREILSSPDDPRLRRVADGCSYPWSSHLIDQSIRRLLAGMRDWSTLVGRSDDGTEVLILMSDLRAELMALIPSSQDMPDLASRCAALRWKCRTLALCFERWSGALSPRSEILTSCDGLNGRPPDMTTSRADLNQRITEAQAQLHSGSPEVQSS